MKFFCCFLTFFSLSISLYADEDTLILPKRYYLNYPTASVFCEPIKGAIQDAATTHKSYKGKRIVAHPNGGYGRLFDIGGNQLYHTGTDIGWFQVGEPVYAVANGVVRISMGSMRKQLAKRGLRITSNKFMGYGNLIMIEHTAPTGETFNSFYAHLSDQRLVRAGDIVSAGQQIGSIGRKSGTVNGGYDPHLHFAMRTGKISEIPETAIPVPWAGRTMAEVRTVGENTMLVSLPDSVPSFKYFMGPSKEQLYEINVTKFEDGHEMPSWLLYGVYPMSREMHLGGYVPEMVGWLDPMDFLKTRGAATNPPTYFGITKVQDIGQPQVLDEAVPDLEFDAWINFAQDDLSLTPFRNKTICLIVFQIPCVASKGLAVPALKTLHNEYENSKEIQIVGVNAATKSPSRYPLDRLQEFIAEEELEAPIGYVNDPTMKFCDQLGIRGTPWVIMINPDGKIEFSNACLNADGVRQRLAIIVSQHHNTNED